MSQNIDEMMLRFTNLTTSSNKASSFKGPPIKEIKVTPKTKTAYEASQKARDWSQFQGLDDVFSSNSSTVAEDKGNNSNDDWGDFVDSTFEEDEKQLSNVPTAMGVVQMSKKNISIAPSVTSLPSINQGLLLESQVKSNISNSMLLSSGFVDDDDDEFDDFKGAELTVDDNDSFKIEAVSSAQGFESNNLFDAGSSQKDSNAIIGSRLASFETESPIHQFKNSNNKSLDNKDDEASDNFTILNNINFDSNSKLTDNFFQESLMSDHTSEDKYSVFKNVKNPDLSDVSGTSSVMVNEPKNDEFGDFIEAEPVITDTITEDIFLSTKDINYENEDSVFNVNKKESNLDSLLDIDLNLPFVENKIPPFSQASPNFESLEKSCISSVINNNLTPETLSIASLDFQQPPLDMNNLENTIESEECANNEDDLTDFAPATNLPPAINQNICQLTIQDRYKDLLALDSENSVEANDTPYQAWNKCLIQCFRCIEDAADIFNAISSASVLEEVVNSEAGKNFAYNIFEVYRVFKRIELSYSKLCLDIVLTNQIENIDKTWKTFSSHIENSNVKFDRSKLDFSSAVLSNDPSNFMNSCAICLLNVHETFALKDDKLSYGNRQYHSACANFWVNCVECTLPVLPFNSLL